MRAGVTRAVGMWLLVGVVLLAALGVVTVLQRMSEFQRRLKFAREQRSSLAERLTKLQSEARFSEVFQDGEAAALSKQIRQQVDSLLTEFTKESRRLDQHHGGVFAAFSMDAFVGVTRILETFEQLDKDLTRVQADVDRLDELLHTVKQASTGLENTWKSLKKELESALGADVPQTFRREWQEIESKVAQLSFETDEVRQTLEQKRLQEALAAWDRRLSRLRTWADWKGRQADRFPILEATIRRLEEAGAKETTACSHLKTTLLDAKELASFTALQAVEDANAALVQRVGADLSGLLNRASVLLTYMGDWNLLKQERQKLRDRVRALVEDLDSNDSRAKEREIARSLPDWQRSYEADKESFLSAARAVLSGCEREAQSPREAVVQADALLGLNEQGLQLSKRLNRQWEHKQEHVLELEARLRVLSRQVAEALAKLADANLMDSQEYRKLSEWQQDVHRMQESSTADETRVERMEEKVENEIKVVEAAVSARSRVDSSLQEHLDRLVRRHEGGSRQTVEGMRKGAFEPFEDGTANAAVWASLALAESVLAEQTFATWDDW